MKVGDLYSPIIRLLAGRTLSNAFLAEYIRKGVLELTENYKFQGLQVTGPTVQFTALLPYYPPSYFLATADATLEVNKMNSFFMFLNTYAPPSLTASTTNAGYNLTFRTINDIEVLINIPGTPIYWTRHEGNIWIGSCPDKGYYTYARYQKEHPFPNAGNANAGNDPILLPNSWQDIVEYQSAMRGAQELNLSSKVSEFNARLYGDQKFQQSGGLEGSPGLIFQRTSQENRDQSTSRKSFRLRMGSV